MTHASASFISVSYHRGVAWKTANRENYDEFLVLPWWDLIIICDFRRVLLLLCNLLSNKHFFFLPQAQGCSPSEEWNEGNMKKIILIALSHMLLSSALILSLDICVCVCVHVYELHHSIIFFVTFLSSLVSKYMWTALNKLRDLLSISDLVWGKLLLFLKY